MDCRVVLEAAVPVYDVATPDEAIRIGISKVGEALNPDLSYVEIETAERRSPSGEELEPAFVVADEALVALELEMTVFNVEGEEHATRIARKEIGQQLENVPLKVVTVDDVDETADDEAADTSGSDSPAQSSDDAAGDESADEQSDGDDGDEDLLPEFEEMV